MGDAEVADVNEYHRECLEHYKHRRLVRHPLYLRYHQLTGINNTINDREIDCDQKKDWFDKEHFQWAQKGTVQQFFCGPFDFLARRI